MSWTDDDLLGAAGSRLLGAQGGPLGYDGQRVELVGNELLLDFRWRQHPRTFRFRLPLADRSQGPWTGTPTASASEWVSEASGLLAEELETGATRRLVRREDDGVMELRLHDPPSWPSDYYASSFDPSAADWLADDGLDVAAAQTAEAAGTLLTWAVLLRNDEHGEPAVAQLVLVRFAM